MRFVQFNANDKRDGISAPHIVNINADRVDAVQNGANGIEIVMGGGTFVVKDKSHAQVQALLDSPSVPSMPQQQKKK